MHIYLIDFLFESILLELLLRNDCRQLIGIFLQSELPGHIKTNFIEFGRYVALAKRPGKIVLRIEIA